MPWLPRTSVLVNWRIAQLLRDCLYNGKSDPHYQHKLKRKETCIDIHSVTHTSPSLGISKITQPLTNTSKVMQIPLLLQSKCVPRERSGKKNCTLHNPHGTSSVCLGQRYVCPKHLPRGDFIFGTRPRVQDCTGANSKKKLTCYHLLNHVE